MRRKFNLLKSGKKIMIGVFVIALGFMFVLPGLTNGTLGVPDNNEIYLFEDIDLRLEKRVDVGTSWDELELPESLRAQVFVYSEKPQREDSVYETASNDLVNDFSEEYETFIEDEAGHVILTNENEEADQIDTDAGYGQNDENIIDDPGINIETIILDIPVTWEGLYDGEVPGTYILTAQIHNYSYSGVLPTFEIIVSLPEEEKTGSISGNLRALYDDNIILIISGLVGEENISGNNNEGLIDDLLARNGAQMESPLVNYAVYLYFADDLTNHIAETQTDENGFYKFSELEPGDYVLGIKALESNDVIYNLPSEITDDNNFSVNLYNDLQTAFTEEIEINEAVDIEDINGSIQLSVNMTAGYVLDLSIISNGGSGPGWSYSGSGANNGTGTITFDSSASNNVYTIIKSVASSDITRDVIINADVSDVTVLYDGQNIKMTSYGGGYYGDFCSNVDVRGGSNNTIIFENIYNFEVSNITVSSNANSTCLIHRGSSNLETTITDNGIDTITSYEGVKDSFIVTLLSNNTLGRHTMILLGNNSFESSIFKAADNTELTLLLSGFDNFIDGRIVIPPNAKMNIDSLNLPGSDSGSVTITQNNSGHACIGSDGGSIYGSSSGLITIYGGTVTAIQTGDSTGAAIGGGEAWNGNVEIYGGKVIASAVDGAAIGGGSGSNAIGFVEIFDGIIEATSNGCGAAIGGGKSGTGNVIIHNGTVTAACNPTYSNGAAIGGGQRTSSFGDSGMGIVTIYNGNITATSNYGAAIGGGAGAAGSLVPGIPNVTIYDGNFNLKSLGGACVGAGGYLNAFDGDNNNRGFINIYGGTVFADFWHGNAIGGGHNVDNHPLLTLNAKADILAFGRGHSNFPGIDTGDDRVNLGDGHYVNLNLVDKKVSGNRILVVYDKTNMSSPVRVVEIPYDFYLFSYTTGTTVTRVDNVFIGNASEGLTQLRRAKDKSTDLYSVKSTLQYDKDGMTPPNPPYLPYWRSLYVEYGQGVGFEEQWPVLEYFVDIDGNMLSIPDNPNAELINAGEEYTKAIPDLRIYGYIAIGYKWDEEPAGINDGDILADIPSRIINKTEKIYYIYKEDPGLADITVSKTVSGRFSNKTIEFAFSVALMENDGITPLFGTFTGEFDDGRVIQITNGSVFSLKHGSAVTIKDIPVDSIIIVTEITNTDLYTVSVEDSIDGVIPGNTTGTKTVVTDGKRFEFINERIIVPPTGIHGEGLKLLGLLPVVIFVSVIGLIAFRIKKKVNLSDI